MLRKAYCLIVFYSAKIVIVSQLYKLMPSTFQKSGLCDIIECVLTYGLFFTACYSEIYV